MPLNPISGPLAAGVVAHALSHGAITPATSAPTPPCSTTRRFGSLTSWMLGLEDGLLSSIVSKSLAIAVSSFGDGVLQALGFGRAQIGRASCRERVELWVVGV